MSSLTDRLLDRIKLRKKMRLWRTSSLILAVILLLTIIAGSEDSSFAIGKDYIARISITGIIQEDIKRTEGFKKLENNDKVKAVVIYIDSPGGTAVGGEELYDSIRSLSAKKPVVSVMGSLATSAAYLAAMGTERIFAHKATITGSIGVILQSPDITELAKKLGISMDIIKTGPMKGVPSPFEKLNSEGRETIQEAVNSFYYVFIDILKEERDLSEEVATKLADGRVFTGLQAIDNGLIDEIGGEEQAIKWLNKDKGISSSLKVKDFKFYKEEPSWKEFLSSAIGNNALIPKEFFLQGMLSIWQNGVID